MYKIDSDFEIVKKIFNSSSKNFVFQSIIEGNTPGEIYLNRLINPELYVIFDKGNFVIYVGGDTTAHEEYTRCIEYIKEYILTEDLKKEFYDYIKISYTSDLWKNALLDVFYDLKVYQDKRALYKYDIANIQYKTPESSSYEVKPINEEVLKDSRLENFELLKEEILGMWGSIEGFIKNGFGYCAVDGRKLISWCTAELVSRNHCGIGIETIEEQQRKGVGAVLAVNFLKECATRNLEPYWDSWTRNLGSVKIAEKVGFYKVEEYDVLIVEF
ncbi:GNAT family N-acetyltransferase [Clostridium tunisiense]|uniref:GNAT family N-acetyltransferase n=1 Tax=Clostridium tunisiense TaxID=219748 RepID=UPI0003191020|nr:GNAT family N-acetyltransferase [Clostridium tunisiense]